jgi:hypothetical protein
MRQELILGALDVELEDDPLASGKLRGKVGRRHGLRLPGRRHAVGHEHASHAVARLARRADAQGPRLRRERALLQGDAGCKLRVHRNVPRQHFEGARVRLEGEDLRAETGAKERDRPDPGADVEYGRARPGSPGEGGQRLGLPAPGLDPVPERVLVVVDVEGDGTRRNAPHPGAQAASAAAGRGRRRLLRRSTLKPMLSAFE